MTERTARLRQESLDAAPRISSERAEQLTLFYRGNIGRYSQPVMRALAYHFLCENKTIWIGDGELIVGERGPAPKQVPTYPELTCHALEDLRILDSRPKTSYAVDQGCLEVYEDTVIPFWRGRSLLVLGQGQPHGQEAPRRAHLVVAVDHVAGLAGWRRSGLGQRAVLFQQVAHAVLG